jgi:tetratricopeptide (TPR) repeat protein
LELARGLFAQVAQLASDVSQRDWAKLNAASILAEQGKHDDAFFALREVSATSSDPEVILQSKMGMAAVYQEKGNFEKALELLDAAETGGLGPAWAASVVQAQVASELGLGRTAEARDRWQQLLSTFGGHEEAKAQATLGLADIALQEGNHDAAIALFQEVAGSDADRFFQAQAGVGWARGLLAAGESSRAADQFEAVIRDFEDHPEFTEVARSALSGL